MSYKVKSLLYFAVFVASAFIYDATNNTVVEKTVAMPLPEKTVDAITDNPDDKMQEEADLLEETVLNN